MRLARHACVAVGFAGWTLVAAAPASGELIEFIGRAQDGTVYQTLWNRTGALGNCSVTSQLSCSSDADCPPGERCSGLGASGLWITTVAGGVGLVQDCSLTGDLVMAALAGSSAATIGPVALVSRSGIIGSSNAPLFSSSGQGAVLVSGIVISRGNANTVPLTSSGGFRS